MQNNSKSAFLVPIVGLVLHVAACQETQQNMVVLQKHLFVSTETLEFGETVVGLKKEREFTIENTGQLDLSLKARFSGDNKHLFAINQESIFLAVGQSVILSANFAPIAVGSRQSRLHIEDESEEITETLTLTGTAILPICDDNNTCTLDFFDATSGVCTNQPVAGDCDDGNACTEDDKCASGLCVGQSRVCDDDIDCTQDYCDPGEGCLALPMHDRCTGPEVCRDYLCDIDFGCQESVAADGTICGGQGCQDLAVCISGACHHGPVPDGMPCDDGSPCTTGDSCLSGVCVPGQTSGPDGVGQAHEIFLDSLDLDTDNWPTARTFALLALKATSAGGLDIVWAHLDDTYDQPCEIFPKLILFRTRIGQDFQVVLHQRLAAAGSARATFVGDDLLLLVSPPCQDTPVVCGDATDCGEWYSQIQLYHFPLDDTISPEPLIYCNTDFDLLAFSKTALAANDQTAFAILSDGGADMVALRMDSPSFAPAILPLSLMDINEPVAIEEIAMRAGQDQMEMVLRRRSIDTRNADCLQCYPNSLCRETPSAAFQVAFEHGHELNWVDLDLWGVSQVQLLPSIAAGITETWHYEFTGSECTPYPAISSFALGSGDNNELTIVQQDELFRDNGYSYNSEFVMAQLHGKPAVATLSAQQVLGIIYKDSSGEIQQQSISPPQPDLRWADRDGCTAMDCVNRFPLMVTYPGPAGFWVVALTTMATNHWVPVIHVGSGMAIFHVGCDSTIPALR